MNKKIIIGIIIIAVILVSAYFYFKQSIVYTPITGENCTSEGENTGSALGPQVYTPCCLGLIQKNSKTAYDESCQLVVEGFGTICINCGNNRCEEWENKCNCPEDCI